MEDTDQKEKTKYKPWAARIHISGTPVIMDIVMPIFLENLNEWKGNKTELGYKNENTSDISKKILEIFHNKDQLVPEILVKHLNGEYSNIILEGLHANPPPIPIKGQIGKRKQPHSKNLPEQMQKHQNEILLFVINPLVPFDNNLAERDIRMPKLKMKISELSGCLK
jgi:hypothetical protein